MNNEISAEMLLGHLYPELELFWTVRKRGTFYRNYSPDVMNIDEAELTVELSRDGLLNLVPPAMLTGDFELTKNKADGRRHKKGFKTRYEEMKQRLTVLKEAFVPLDTFKFRGRLATERYLQMLLESSVTDVLKEYYGFDLQHADDPLVAKAAQLLPLVVNRRGDIRFVKRLLETVTGHKVKTRQSAFSDTDNSKYWMQKVDFDIVVDGLTPQAYQSETERLKPLIDFVQQYMLPIEIICSFNVVGRNNEVTILNYNTNVL